MPLAEWSEVFAVTSIIVFFFFVGTAVLFGKGFCYLSERLLLGRVPYHIVIVVWARLPILVTAFRACSLSCDGSGFCFCSSRALRHLSLFALFRGRGMPTTTQRGVLSLLCAPLIGSLPVSVCNALVDAVERVQVHWMKTTVIAQLSRRQHFSLYVCSSLYYDRFVVSLN